MIKKLLLLSVLVLAVSCGGGGGANTTPTPKPPTSGTQASTVSECAVTFEKGDSPKVIATKANQARVECNMDEAQVLELVGKI